MAQRTCNRQAWSTLVRQGCRHYGVELPSAGNVFASIDTHVQSLREIVGEAGCVTNQDALAAHNRDWMGKYHGSSQVCLKPKAVSQVSAILRYCNQHKLPVVPQGGNTGLVGGSVPMQEEVVVSLACLNSVRHVCQSSGVVVADAGCILQTLDDAVGQHGYCVPLDLGAKGSCHIGGNVATNAGGLRLLRYGSLHGSVLGLEVVLADGTVLDLLTMLRKDNTGYDLKQLFIGSEGTLGIITAVALQCAPLPRAVHVAYLACSTFDHVQRVFAAAKRLLGEVLSAFEFFDLPSLHLTLQHIPATQDPLPAASSQGVPLYLVVETHGSNAEHDAAKMENFLEHVLTEVRTDGKDVADVLLAHLSGDSSVFADMLTANASSLGLVVDGTLAQDGQQAGGIWKIRESISEALRHAGAVYKYDLSMPIADMYRCVEDTRQHLAADFPDATVIGYGHLGDGNLHLNISAAAYTAELTAAIEPWVYQWTAQRRGSISAEHGIGQMKVKALHFSKPPQAVRLMQQLKQVFDPRGILNPGKVLPAAHLPVAGAAPREAHAGWGATNYT